MAPELEAKRVSLSLDLQVADDHILGDRVQLQQLMHNLVSNAVEAIDARPLPDRRIQVTSMREGGGRRPDRRQWAGAGA
jgi:C4-dicarboxylate-specific signal transduction histidine kinase